MLEELIYAVKVLGLIAICIFLIMVIVAMITSILTSRKREEEDRKRKEEDRKRKEELQNALINAFQETIKDVAKDKEDE